MFRRSLTLVHIAAIPVRIHWSWPVIVVFLLVGLAPAYGRVACGGRDALCAAAWLPGAAAGLLICASVLLHELGHALVARRYAVPVSSITLFAFGGVAEVEAEMATPRAEFAVAVAGPAVSLALAMLAGLAWWLGGGASGGAGLPLILAGHLTLANGIMAVFNLLPAYPMDGGRLLRAILWFLGDDVVGATRIASRVGQVCGAALGALGIALAFAARYPLAALWLGLIGWFIYRTATRSYRQFVLHTALAGIRVAELMQRTVRTVSPELTIEQFVARYVLGQPEQSFPVVRRYAADYQVQIADLEEPSLAASYSLPSTVLVGMISVRNLRRYTTHEWPFTHIAEAMTPLHRITPLSPQLSASEALKVMADCRAETLPVTDGDTLLGVLRQRDLAIYIQMKGMRRRH